MADPKFFTLEARAGGGDYDAEVSAHVSFFDEAGWVAPADIRDRRVQGDKLRALASLTWCKGRFCDLVSAECLLVSGRMHDVLVAEEIRDFDHVLIEFDSEGSDKDTPRGFVMPEYWAVVPRPGIVLRHQADIDDPVAWSSAAGRRYVAIDDSWTGADLFRGEGVSVRAICTRRVLELARKERWTNLRFRPLDLRLDYPWEIDYLGDQWPPHRWYPSPYSEGKTAEEWFSILHDPKVADAELKERAGAALTWDLPEEALSLFLDRMRATSGLDQFRAAKTAHYLTTIIDVDDRVITDQILPVIVKFLRSDDPSIRELAGHSILAMKRSVNLDSSLMESAYRAIGKRPSQ